MVAALNSQKRSWRLLPNTLVPAVSNLHCTLHNTKDTNG